MIHCVLSSMARILGSGTQRGELEVVPFTIPLDNSLAEILPLCAL